MLIADFGLGEALVTVVSVFFFVIWIWILITILTDLFRDQEVSGWAKAAWVFFLVFVPFVDRADLPDRPRPGDARACAPGAGRGQAAFDDYVRDTAAGAPVEELHRLHDLKEKGGITDEEYERMKAKLLESGAPASSYQAPPPPPPPKPPPPGPPEKPPPPPPDELSGATCEEKPELNAEPLNATC